MWIIILVGLLVLWIYFKITNSYKYWQDKGVPYVKPFFIFGNLAPNILRRQPFAYMIEDLYKTYPNERYVGIYQFLKPTLLIRDPDLIKEITVKDFDTFPDHKAMVTGEADPLFNRNLFAMTSKDGWHDMRAALSPSFTSSKMRTMFILMQECSKQFLNYFKAQSGDVTVELKDAFTRFTNDVIGSTAFGVTCNSLEDRNNEFYLMGKDATNFSGLKLFKFFGYTVVPNFMKLFKIKFLSKEVNTFFRSLIKETVRIREEKQIIRPDMVHLLMEARKGRLINENTNSVVDTGFAVAPESEIKYTEKRKKISMSDDDIAAQALIFFLAGFDTAATLMCYTAYELAINTDIQEKLCYEVDKVTEECNGKITYEALLGMKYFDNVISETLRLHSPSRLTDRCSIKPYKIQPGRPGEKSVYLDTDSLLWIPIHAIHMDPKYYTDPERFDPGRFNDENKHKIKPFTYLPFGTGPRNCIGSRFALLETKLIITELLRTFKIVPVEKTPIPLILSKTNPLPMPDEGIWVGLKPRYLYVFPENNI